MSTALATADETAVAVPSTFINPLSIDVTADRVDAAVNALIDSAVGTVENEMKRMARRREVAAAVRGIQQAKADLDGISDIDLGGGMGGLMVDGHRAELIEMFQTLNPAASEKVVVGVVDAFMAPYKEPKAKRGKSSGGS